MDTSETTWKAPYLSFQTFWNFVGYLCKKPLPPVIDRSVMDSKSGTDQANLTAALKAFGLIRDDLSVEPLLQELAVADEDARKKLLARMVEQNYGAALQVSEANGTEQMLSDSFKTAYKMEAADTRRKAVTFFLHAAREAGLPLSPYFPATRSGSNGTSTGTARRKSTLRKAKANGVATPNPPSAAPSGAGETKVIDFGDAGSVTIVVNVKWLALPTETMVDLRKAVDAFETLGASTTPTAITEAAIPEETP